MNLHAGSRQSLMSPVDRPSMLNKWIVILNYNVAEHCVRNLHALCDMPDVGLFFVDNSGRTSDYEALKAACADKGAVVLEPDGASQSEPDRSRLGEGARIVLVRNPRNLGYSGGNNTALRLLDPLLGERGQYLVLNPDVFITPETAAALLDTDADLCGPAIYEHWRQGVAIEGLSMDFATGFYAGPPADARKISMLHGSCLKMSGRALAKYGFLPDDNFLYEEEIRYFERVHRLGGDPVYLRHLQVEHVGKASTQKLSYLYFYYIFRNRLSYFLEIAGPHYRKYGKFCWQYLCWMQDVIRSQARKRNWSGIRGMLRGVWDGMRGIKGPFPEPRLKR